MEINIIANKIFEGKVVRKDLVSRIKGGANVPVYVLEYLLGMYCSSNDESLIADGIERVKSILEENYVRPDEAEKIKSKIREKGSYTVIDKITVKLNERSDRYEATLSNLGTSNIIVTPNDVKNYEKLLAGGIWCILNMSYYYDELEKNSSPFIIDKLKPIQIANLDMNEIKEGRKEFNKDQWIDFLIRSTGMESNELNETEKWHLLARLIPLVENNYNMCELGPRGTGKSYIYKEISPNSILISGGQTTVANLFYNMARRQIGLVGYWDVVAFDEVAGIRFKDKDGIQIMKDFMASGSFARGKDNISANASMVFIGNINQSIDVLVRTAHLLVDFPPEMNYDSAFFDRMHSYIPGWEIPKMRPEYFTKEFGFIVDYMAEIFRELRKVSYGDALDKYFILGRELNQRDVIAVRKTVSGFIKLIYPDGNYEKEEIQEILERALSYRRRVKEQLKKMSGMEFYDTHFSYIDKDSNEEIYVSLKEQGGNKLIPEGQLNAGSIFSVSETLKGNYGLYKFDTELTAGSGKLKPSDKKLKSFLEKAFNYLTINSKKIGGIFNIKEKDYYLTVQDIQNIGISENITLGGFISMCSSSLNRPVMQQLVILGEMEMSGTIYKVSDLATVLQVCYDSGAKKALIPMANVADFAKVPSQLISEIQPIFYSDPIEAVMKALGLN